MKNFMEVDVMAKNYTLEETLKLLGLSQGWVPLCKKAAKDILPTTTGEPDWMYARVDVREREDGCPELAIYIPFGIKGL